ncbi:MAG: hypothetical protein ACI90V_001579 [Bacillariaceae sp.]|jgi:hypothetical protein
MRYATTIDTDTVNSSGDFGFGCQAKSQRSYEGNTIFTLLTYVSAHFSTSPNATIRVEERKWTIQ